MKTQTLSLSTILGFLGLILIIHILNAQAKADTNTIHCSTAFNEKKMVINGNQISFHDSNDGQIKRSISSTNQFSVRTHVKHLGFTKTLYIDGHKYLINIHNTNQFSEVDDYLSISSPKGHVMTYPLNCNSV